MTHQKFKCFNQCKFIIFLLKYYNYLWIKFFSLIINFIHYKLFSLYLLDNFHQIRSFNDFIFNLILFQFFNLKLKFHFLFFHSFCHQLY